MKIEILCSDPKHPVAAQLQQWCDDLPAKHEAAVLTNSASLTSGDVLFLVSCTEIIPTSIRKNFCHTLVLHASDLPKGRGWSPHIWQILEGHQSVTLSLLNASDLVDTGDIWAKRSIEIPRHFLFDEINAALFEAEFSLMNEGLRMIESGEAPVPQADIEATYYPRRTPDDSEVDPDKSLRDLFNQIRVCDPNRYPAFFELHGIRYTIELKKELK